MYVRKKPQAFLLMVFAYAHYNINF